MAIAPGKANATPAEGGPTTRVTWLTLASLLTSALHLALGPNLDVLPHYATSMGVLKHVLQYPDRSDLFNGLRASLAADMVFLLAYGALLRASVLWHEDRRLVPWVANLCLLLMAADFAENATTLHLLSRMQLDAPATWDGLESWVLAMNGASVAKWLVSAVVSGALARLWWGSWSNQPRLRQVACRLIVASFALGALASVVTAAAYLAPRWAPAAAFGAFGFPAFALLLQAFALGMPGRLARFLVLTRVPLGALMFLIAFGPLAIGPLRSLLGGLLALNGPMQLGQLAGCTLLAALSCGAQINVFSCYASLRMLDTDGDQFATDTTREITFQSCIAASLALPVCAFLASDQMPIGAGLAAMLLGQFIAVTTFVMVEWVVARTMNPVLADSTPYLVTPSLSPALGAALKRTRRRQVVERGALSKVRKGVSSVLHELLAGPGYFTDAGSRHYLLPGITLASAAMLCTAVTFGAMVWGKLSNPPDLGNGLLPTVDLIVVLVVMVSWMLASATYYFDRYRVPLFSLGVSVALVTGGCPATDHVFQVRPEEGRYHEPTPGEVLSTFQDRPIVVAIAGGGIQAGAWGTEVLAELDKNVLAGGLRARVALVSAVSGGAMGALFYGAHFDAGPARARSEAIKPSLEQVAATFLGADIWRVVGGVPFVDQTFDRGRALERSWQVRMQDGPLPADGGPTMRDWAELAGTRRSSGRFPAFVFNTTVVETGQPLAIATTAMPSRALVNELKGQLSQSPIVEHFNSLYRLADPKQGPRDAHLAMATAARMSSTFPYVSPAAAPQWPAQGPWAGLPRYHLVDGGYYDNFGLFALTQWLDDALIEMSRRGLRMPPTVEVVVIRGETAERPPSGVTTGWARQLSAPASAFVATRSYGQWAGGSSALKLLKDKWKSQTEICDVAFAYPVQTLRDELPICADPPLSWQLTAANTRCLDAAWRHSATAVEVLRKIEAAVARGTPTCGTADASQ